MGCDIHACVEWREHSALADRGEWWSALTGEMHWGRSYSFFTALAGVRCYVCEWGKCTHMVVPPRGWPVERALFSPFERDDADYHTPSWLTLDEFKRASAGVDWPEVLGVIAMMEAIEKTGHPTRLVFAFDS